MATTTFTDKLSRIDCCRCFASFGITDDAERSLRRSHKYFYCPYCGTPQSWRGESDIERAEKAAKRANELREREKRWREAAERSLSATKGAMTKMRKRAAAGVCPCCNRTFKQLAAHMKSQHPEYQD